MSGEVIEEKPLTLFERAENAAVASAESSGLVLATFSDVKDGFTEFYGDPNYVKGPAPSFEDEEKALAALTTQMQTVMEAQRQAGMTHYCWLTHPEFTASANGVYAYARIRFFKG